ncbi:MAG: tetratricopeptide repeat protein [Gemmataceae bacterium]|nr:tetratricopeptide repeat protein [Gemmataceae bacterium]
MSMSPFRRLVPNRWLRLGIAAGLVAAAAALLGRHAWAYAEYRAGRAALDRYKFKDAQDRFRNCLGVWPSRADIWLLAGQAARRMERYDEAERCYAEALRLSGGVASDDLRLEQVLLQTQLDPDSKSDYLRAEVEAGHPKAVLMFEAIVRGYVRRSRYPDAGYVVGLWLGKSPDDPYALFLRGFVREQLGPQSEGIDDYRRVLELDRDHDEARYRLTHMLLENGQPAEALRVIRVLVDKYPGEPKALAQAAEAEFAVGEFAAAEATARAALAADPASDDALLALGRVLTAADRHDEAERYLREAIRVSPSSYAAYLQLYQTLKQVGRDAEAARVKADLDRMGRDILRLRAIFSGELSAARQSPALYTEVGEIFLRAGEEAKALQWLGDALRYDPDYAPAHRALAGLYDRRGDQARAAQHRRPAGPPGP